MTVARKRRRRMKEIKKMCSVWGRCTKSRLRGGKYLYVIHRRKYLVQRKDKISLWPFIIQSRNLIVYVISNLYMATTKLKVFRGNLFATLSLTEHWIIKCKYVAALRCTSLHCELQYMCDSTLDLLEWVKSQILYIFLYFRAVNTANNRTQMVNKETQAIHDGKHHIRMTVTVNSDYTQVNSIVHTHHNIL